MQRVAAPAPFRPGLGSAMFLAVMLGSTVATMLRMVLAAWFLLPADFAVYATIVATGAFLSTILSFGAIEATIKNFPRLAGQGREAELLPESRRIMKRLALRAGILGVPVLAAGALLDIEWLRLWGLACLFALNTAYTAVLASMQRAAGTAATLAAGTALRSGGVLAAVALAAFYGDLTMVLIAETLATVLTCLVSERIFFGAGSTADPAWGADDIRPPSSPSRFDGVHLFLAYSLISMPFYLDRLFVTTTMGLNAGAQYAVLALFLTAASLLVNTLAQRSGPEAIRLVQRDGNARAARRQILMWCLIASLIWLLAIAAAAAVIATGLLPKGLERYLVDPHLLAPIAISGALLCTGLIEFLLIALDRERAMLRAAALFALTVVATASAVAWFKLDLADFMWLLAACRAFYLLLLLSSLPWRDKAASGA